MADPTQCTDSRPMALFAFGPDGRLLPAGRLPFECFHNGRHSMLCCLALPFRGLALGPAARDVRETALE